MSSVWGRFISRAENVWNRPSYAASRLFFRVAGGKSRPVHYDIDETYPSLRALDEHWREIRNEVEALLPEKATIPKYHELDPYQRPISAVGDPGKSWNVFMLYAMGESAEKNRSRCPVTSGLLDGIPNLYEAFFSILDPGKSIPAHDGPYLGYLRYHLGLIVPKNDPPTLRVADWFHTWREGESILFDDSWNHEVFNESDGIRVVLIVDVLRPMVWPISALNRYVTYRRIRAQYAHKVLEAATR